MGFEVGPNGKVRKTKAGSTPKKNATKPNKPAAAQSKAGSAPLNDSDPYSLKAMSERLAAARKNDPRLAAANLAGRRQGGRRTRRNRRSLRSRRQ